MRITIIRIIKYLLNIAGLTWMGLLPVIAYGLIVNKQSPEHATETIKDVATSLAIVYTIYLIVITGLNYLSGRFLEKRNESKEYLYLALVQFLALALFAFFVSYNYYSYCSTL